MARNTGRGGKQKDRAVVDPEEIMRQKFRAKCRFRAIYRMVLANAYWLIEDVDQYEGVDDVKRRVQQAVRGKAKKKQLLTITDKALLNKNTSDRTDQEKKYLYRILGGLKCFKKYPNHVKKRLAAMTYFKYYSPGRVVVREHHEGHALYFIVTGDVSVSKLIWDGLLQQYVPTEISVMHPGDIFGEVSLLHNILRTATVTTVGHCELLALVKEDFKCVLQSTVQKQWDEVRHAMSVFTYFDELDDMGLREGCIMAKMRSYNPNDTILGDGVGMANYVYFVLTGSCQMIESLQVVITRHLGKTFYTLYDPWVPKGESEHDLDKKYFAGYKNLNQSSTSASASDGKDTSQQRHQDSESLPASKMKTESILKPENSSKQTRLSTASRNILTSEEGDKRVSMSVHSETILHPDDSTTRHRESIRLSVQSEVKADKPAKPPNMKTFFMQVVQYKPGATFGFGENMRDRRIIALTPVTCLLLPLIWLLQRNTANIWTRIHYYLEKKIPDKKTLFKEFVKEYRWQQYRDQIVEDVVNACNTVNSTSVHDVPYSIRLEEMHDI